MNNQRHIPSTTASYQIPNGALYRIIGFPRRKFTGEELEKLLFKHKGKDKESMLWEDGTAVQFSSAHERSTEESRELDKEIEELKKANSSAIRRRINTLTRVSNAHKQFLKDNPNAVDYPEWKAFKDKYAELKKQAKEFGDTWSWKDEDKVYNDIK